MFFNMFFSFFSSRRRRRSREPASSSFAHPLLFALVFLSLSLSLLAFQYRLHVSICTRGFTVTRMRPPPLSSPPAAEEEGGAGAGSSGAAPPLPPTRRRGCFPLLPPLLGRLASGDNALPFSSQSVCFPRGWPGKEKRGKGGGRARGKGKGDEREKERETRDERDLDRRAAAVFFLSFPPVFSFLFRLFLPIAASSAARSSATVEPSRANVRPPGAATRTLGIFRREERRGSERGASFFFFFLVEVEESEKSDAKKRGQLFLLSRSLALLLLSLFSFFLFFHLSVFFPFLIPLQRFTVEYRWRGE